jgi:hypothetical protein
MFFTLMILGVSVLIDNSHGDTKLLIDSGLKASAFFRDIGLPQSTMSYFDDTIDYGNEGCIVDIVMQYERVTCQYVGLCTPSNEFIQALQNGPVACFDDID